MRIIAGTYRGRTIEGPPSDKTRPILDRAKTVLFDMLGTRLAVPGKLPPIAVLDLFCGTGTIGIEALSRGVRYCCFVEQHRETVAVLRRNLDALRAGPEAEIRAGSATAGNVPPPSPDENGIAQYELVFVDPPYRMIDRIQPTPAIRDLLQTLASSSAVSPSAIIVVRHEAAGGPRPDLSPLIEIDAREVGKMWLRFMVRPDAPRDGASADTGKDVS